MAVKSQNDEWTMLYGNFNRVACIVFFVKIHYLDDSYPAMVVEWSKTVVPNLLGPKSRHPVL